jgi:hypothetical protein
MGSDVPDNIQRRARSAADYFRAGYTYVSILAELVFLVLAMIYPKSGVPLYTQTLLIGIATEFKDRLCITTIIVMIGALSLNIWISLSDPTLWINAVASMIIGLHFVVYLVWSLDIYRHELESSMKQGKGESNEEYVITKWLWAALFMIIFDITSTNVMRSMIVNAYIIGRFYDYSSSPLNIAIFALFLTSVFESFFDGEQNNWNHAFTIISTVFAAASLIRKS